LKKSSFVSSVAIFASLNVICDAVVIPQFSSGIWYGLVFLTEPITGILLSPFAGFLSTLIGVLVGHVIIPRGIEEFLFTLGAPIGAMISAFVYKGNVKAVFVYYTLLLASYFATPIAWELPIWGMWDVYCAYSLLLFLVISQHLGHQWVWKSNKLGFLLAFCAFIGLEADILFRIFVFIPGQTYQSMYGFSVEILKVVWVSGAFITPVKVAVSTFLTVLLGSRILRTQNVAV